MAPTIKGEHWRDMAGVAMLVSGDTVFVARYHRIATGCTLDAFSTDDGKRRWSVQLTGIGPVAHSKWFNRVQLGLDGADPVVFGHEGPGRGYIEVRDAATGKLVSNTLHAVPGGRPRLAEDLYRELANMLGRQRRYTATVDDFASRHVLSFASDADRAQAFRDAAVKLDRLPFTGGIMRVSIRPDARGRLSIQATRR